MPTLAEHLIRAALIVATLLWLWMLLWCILRDPDRRSWLWMLFVFPLVGGVPYFFLRWLPQRGAAAPRFLARWTGRRAVARAESAARDIGNAYQFIELGDRLWDAGRFLHADEAYAKALEREPDDARALWSVGRAAMQLRDFVTAKEVLGKLVAIDIGYRSGDGSLAYARALLALGEAAAAKAHLVADRKRRRDAQGRVLLATAHADLDETEDALRLIDEVLADAKTAVSPHYRQAVREARALRRRIGFGAGSQADRVRSGASGVLDALGKHPLIAFAVVALCAVGADAFWLRARATQRRALTMFEEELADSLGFDLDVLRTIKDHTGAELEMLMAPADEGGFTVEGVYAEWPALWEDEGALDRIRSDLEGRGYQAFRHVPGPAAWAVGVIQGADQFEIVRAMRTRGKTDGVTTDDIVAKLREWNERWPLQIDSASFMWVEVRFLGQPHDAAALIEEIRRFCPTLDAMGAEYLATLPMMIQYSQPVMLMWK